MGRKWQEILRFKNIKESEDKYCKKVVHDIIEMDLGIDTSRIRLHAVHHVGKRDGSRCRPIIPRFVCRMYRNQVWSKRGELKKSKVNTDVYITEDYVRAIQKEWDILIKAMVKARNEHNLFEVKVKGRYLYVNCGWISLVISTFNSSTCISWNILSLK